MIGGVCGVCGVRFEDFVGGFLGGAGSAQRKRGHIHAYPETSSHYRNGRLESERGMRLGGRRRRHTHAQMRVAPRFGSEFLDSKYDLLYVDS